jgi:sec-independent protein translocase protein TatB
VFDLSLTKLLVLAVIALVVFGPHELPKIAQQAGRALRDLRRIADGATADLREGLGPEFQDFELQDLSPRRFVQKHLLDDITAAAQPADEDLGGTTTTLTHETAPAGVRTTLLDGENPPFDFDAT